jgi:adenine-specific DNA-methyltransferase
MVMGVSIAELPEFAAEQQRRYDTSTSAIERKERGHFGTPPAIAQFMAAMFSKRHVESIRILDPGAGVGTLSAAVCQRVLAEKRPRKLDFELWENDPKLTPILQETMTHCRDALRAAGHEMNFVVATDDFILANTESTLFKDGPDPSFHLAIVNPPYFKLRKESQQAHAMRHVVHGQPNIYALFMAVTADLLLPEGEMVAITPRSYFNGPYFKRFRNWFFSRMVARHIHVFESRDKAFKDDAVLQENVILHAEKSGRMNNVLLTNSIGRDFAHVERSSVPYEKIVDNSNGDHVVRVTTNRLEHDIVAAMEALPHRFHTLGFGISTGPVVTFRATQFLRHERAVDTAPLLWMHNVRPLITQFPPKSGKPSHIQVSESSKRLLIPAKTYVLLKRFTAKEEKRRLVAGIVTRGDSYSDWIGLENHVNYVYRKGGELTELDAYGLATFFNSALVDRYFRGISGNTQVNATEIRGMPIPDEFTLRQIGEQIKMSQIRDYTEIEKIVGQALQLPPHLVDQLIEVP